MSNKANKPTLTILAIIAPQLVIALLVIFVGGNPDHYLKAIPDKYEIASRVASPKIVLAGGSSVAWGSDSATFSRHCDLPCVNIAINAGQGLAFRFNEAAACCESGDTLVMSLEYYELSLKPSGPIVVNTIANSPSSARFVRGEELKVALDDGVLEFLAQRARATKSRLTNQSKEERFYKKQNFDNLGDFVGQKDQSPDKPPKLILEMPRDLEASMSRLKTFDEQCQSRGIDLYYRLPCIPKSTTDKKMEALQVIETHLKEIFGDRMINTLPESLLADESFFDTPYHLVHPEKIRVSEVLAKRLSEKIKN